MCNLTQFMCNLTAVCLKNRDDQTASVCWSMRVPNPRTLTLTKTHTGRASFLNSSRRRYTRRRAEHDPGHFYYFTILYYTTPRPTPRSCSPARYYFELFCTILYYTTPRHTPLRTPGTLSHVHELPLEILCAQYDASTTVNVWCKQRRGIHVGHVFLVKFLANSRHHLSTNLRAF
jgi:hypothetical protein